MKRKALILISLLLSLFGCKDGTETSLSSPIDKDKTIADENLNINLNYKFSSIVVDESKTTSYLKNIGMVYGSGFVFDLTQLISDEEKTAHLEYYFLMMDPINQQKYFLLMISTIITMKTNLFLN